MHLVILPGWEHTDVDWEAVGTMLSQRKIPYTVVNFPGFGDSAFDHSITSIADMAKWTLGQLDSQSLSPPYVLCGHSFGGRVAAYIAATEPARVKGLILIGSPNIPFQPNQAKLITTINKLIAPFTRSLPETFKRRFRSTDYDAVKGTDKEAFFKTIVHDDQKELLPLIKTHALLVWGEHDEAVPVSVAMQIQNLIPESELTIIPQAGHNLHLDTPVLLSAKIAAYVQTL